MTFIQALTDSPLLYPIGLDAKADVVHFVRMTAADYAASSFLDARAIPPGSSTAPMCWAEVRSAAEALPRRCHFIFHISHVGSTLLSRLVGHHPALFSLREPAILRQLADAHLGVGRPSCHWSEPEFDERLGVFLALWSRTFGPDQTAVIKATSFVNEMSDLLMARVATAQAICMFVSPLTFLKALLSGAISDITGMAEKRVLRLNRWLGGSDWQRQDLSAGETVAMSWLCEMAALRSASARYPARVMWIDFDRFLTEPDAGLAAALRHLGASGADEAAIAITAGPTMGRYAKAPAQGFDARLRQQLLDQAERQHAAEISKGMNWLERAAEVAAVREMLAQVGA